MNRALRLALLLALSWSCSRSHEGDGLTLYGNVELRDARLAFNEQELVASVEVEEGDRVEAGQVLARLRTERLAAEVAEARARRDAAAQVVLRLEHGTRPQEVEQARARVGAAEARVLRSRQDFERIEPTVATGASSAQDLTNARAELDVAEAQRRVEEEALALALAGPRAEDLAEARATLSALDAKLALLDARMRDLTLVAPSSGVIQSRILEPGELASPTRPAFTLALTDPKWVRAYVPETELGRVVQGQEATVISDSFAGERFAGTVGFLSPSAEFTPKSVETADLRTHLVYEVRIVVEDPQDRLRLGMPVTVELGTGRPDPGQ